METKKFKRPTPKARGEFPGWRKDGESGPFYGPVTEELFHDRLITDGEKLTWAAFVMTAEKKSLKDGADPIISHATQEQIAQIRGEHKQTIWEHVQALKARGYLDTERKEWGNITTCYPRRRTENVTT